MAGSLARELSSENTLRSCCEDKKIAAATVVPDEVFLADMFVTAYKYRSYAFGAILSKCKNAYNPKIFLTAKQPFGRNKASGVWLLFLTITGVLGISSQRTL